MSEAVDSEAIKLLKTNLKDVCDVVRGDLFYQWDIPFGSKFRYMHCVQELCSLLSQGVQLYRAVLFQPSIWSEGWEDACDEAEDEIGRLIESLKDSDVRTERNNKAHLPIASDTAVLGKIEEEILKINNKIEDIGDKDYDECIVSLLNRIWDFYDMMREDVERIRNGGDGVDPIYLEKLFDGLVIIRQDIYKDCSTEFERKKMLYDIQHDINKKRQLNTDEELEVVRTEKNALRESLLNDKQYSDLFLDFYQTYMESPDGENNIFNVFPLFKKLYMRTGWDNFLNNSIKYFFYYKREQDLLEKQKTAIIPTVAGVSASSLFDEDTPTLAKLNVIFDPKIFTKEEDYARVHVIILKYIKQNGVDSEVEYQIDSKKQNEWYYIMKAVGEAGIVSTLVFTQTNFVDQMRQWYPKMFCPKKGETEKEMVRRYMGSISAELKYWQSDTDYHEVLIRGMWAHHHERHYQQRKTVRVHGVAEGLLNELMALKRELTSKNTMPRF